MDDNQGTPADAESLGAGTPYDDMDYRALQEAAKSRDLSAGGTADEIKARLLEADAAPPADDETEDQAPTGRISAADALAAAQAKIDARHGR